MPEGDKGVEAAALARKVGDQGDPADVKRLTGGLTGRVQPGTLAVLSSLTSPLLMEIVNRNPDQLDFWLEHSLLVLATGAVAKGIHWARREVEKRKVAKAEGIQQEFRELVGEEVDLVRTREKSGIRRKKGDVIMRWYDLDGMDGSKTDAETVRKRLAGLVEVAELSGLKRITMGTEALSVLLKDDGKEKVDWEKYGTVVNQEDFLQSEKLLAKKVRDKNADAKLLTATIDQCKSILGTLEMKGKEWRDLIEIIHEVPVSSLFAAWKKSGKASDRDRLERTLARRLLPLIQDIRGTRGAGGKSDLHYNVVGDQFQQIEYGQDERGRPTVTVSPPEHLLRLFHLAPYQLDKLRASAQRENSPYRKERALVALYELVREQRETKRSATKEGEGSQRGKGQSNTPYHRMSEQPERIGRTGKRHNRDEETITYEQADSRLKRLFAAGIILTVMGGASAGAGYGLRQADNAVYDIAAEQVGGPGAQWFNVDSDALEAQIMSNPLEAIIHELVSVSYKSQDNLEAAIVEKGLEEGIPLEFFESIGVPEPVLWQTREYRDFVIQSQVQEDEQSLDQYTHPDRSTTRTGDVESPSNREIYHIESLGGEQTPSGYWYTNLFNTIGVSTEMESYPYTNAGLEYTASYAGSKQEIISVPQDPQVLNGTQEQAELKVMTPYIGNEAISLPIKSRTKVVAARIVDFNNPGQSLPVTILRDSVTGMYQARYDGSEAVFGSMSVPVLEYYLATDINQKIKAVGDMHYSDGTAITPNDVAKVKTALGLSSDASDEEVVLTIAEKKYSYTPIADSGQTATLDATGKSVEEIISTIAASYAGFDEEVCNTANTAGIIGRGGKGNIATGFLVGQDGSISEKRAHLWELTDEGAVVDATPSGTLPQGSVPDDEGQSIFQERAKKEPSVEKPDLGSVPNNDASLDDFLTGGEALAGGIAAYMLYRRRRKIQEIITRGIDGYIDKTYLTDGDSEQARGMHTALDIINYGLFAPEGSTLVQGTHDRPLWSRMLLLPEEIHTKSWDQIWEYTTQHLQKSEDILAVIDTLDQLQSRWGRIRQVAEKRKRQLTSTQAAR